MALFEFSQMTQALLCLAVVLGMFVFFIKEIYPAEVVAL
jgi:hypothetical protein